MSFFASATLCSKYLELAPKSFDLGSSHQPSNMHCKLEFQRVSTGRPSPVKFETLRATSMIRSRSISIEYAWRTRSSLKGEMPCQPKIVWSPIDVISEL